MLIYIVVKDRIRDEDGVSHPVFGVKGYRADWHGIHLAAIEREISFDYGEMLKLAWDCTCGQLDPIHLRDLLEDRFFS